ncbi:MAG: TatD family hydrolase [candidate division WOR-3 bacterium]
MRTRRTESNPQGLVLFDSHVHLTDNKFLGRVGDVVRRAARSGVRAMMVVGQNVPDSYEAVELTRRYEGLYCAVGVHPHEAEGFRGTDANALKELCIESRIKAIGEIGLDFFRTISARPSQEMAFAIQIELARSLDLPMIIHIRDAGQRARQILDEHGYYTGVLHCFSGEAKLAEWAIEKGLYVSFAGNLTYGDERLAGLARTIPLNRLMVETDAPYLAPEPHRGKANEPALIALTVTKLAGIIGLTPKEASRLTFENACNCFRITD